MEKEIARRRLFRRLGSSAQSLVICAHATFDSKQFSRDPVFPNSLGDAKLDIELRKGLAEIENAPPDKTGRISAVKQKKNFVLVYGKMHAVSVPAVAYDRSRSVYSGNDFERDLWMAVYRYKTLDMFQGISASVPPSVYKALLKIEPRAVECFASFFNHTLPGGYYGLFPDVERPFGCKGSFFAIKKPLPLMLCNPPFERCVMNAFVDRIRELLDKGPGEALVILPAFDVDDRRSLNASEKCIQKYPVDYETDVYYGPLKTSAYNRWCGVYCKETFPYVDLAVGKVVHYTSTVAVFLSSYKRNRPAVLEAVKRALPNPDLGCGTEIKK
jgi:hypothetical protein